MMKQFLGPEKDPMSSSAPAGTQAVDRAAALVDLVVRADGPLSFTELSDETGLARSTTSRLLAALERTELVERDPAGGYVAGPLFALHAALHDPWPQIARLARPVLEAVGEQTGETVHLGVRRGEDVVHIAQVESTYLLSARDWNLVDVPPHCSSLGKVLYAFDVLPLPSRLERRTDRTITTREALTAELATIRQQPLRHHRRRARDRAHRYRRARRGTRRRVRRARHLRAHRPAPGTSRLHRSAPRRAGRRTVVAAAPQDPARPHRLQPLTGGRGMTPEEILQHLYDETLKGNAPEVLDLTHQALALDMEPQSLLFDALIPSLEEVGARFERGDFFVPEMLIAGRAMAGAMEVLRPLLADTGVQTIGKFLMGTVKGDVHDIGKNLVNIMLEGAGFEVIDLGVQVAPEKFVEKIIEHEPDIVGFSAFLTTTMPMFKANLNALQKAGLRDQVIVMVGGAPVTQEYADAVGADGYAPDASQTVKRAKDLLQKKRALVTA